MSTSAALHGHRQRDTSKTVRGDPTRLAKRSATINSVELCHKQCGINVPGKRNPSSAGSSPSAYAMYLSTTDYTGPTQSTRITPPGGYSNTNCCATSAVNWDTASCGSQLTPSTPALSLPCDTASPATCCIYRGRGRTPVKKLGPGQLQQWRMGPTPNRMERIGNVKPRSADTTARALRVRIPIATSNVTVKDGNVVPVLKDSSAYTTYVKESTEGGCSGNNCSDGGSWQKWPIIYSAQGRYGTTKQPANSSCNLRSSPVCITGRLATSMQPPLRCAPHSLALSQNVDCSKNC